MGGSGKIDWVHTWYSIDLRETIPISEANNATEARWVINRQCTRRVIKGGNSGSWRVTAYPDTTQFPDRLGWQMGWAISLLSGSPTNLSASRPRGISSSLMGVTSRCPLLCYEAAA